MPNVVVPTCLSCSGVSIGQKKFCNTADLNGIMPSIRDGGCPTDQQIMDAVHNKVRPARPEAVAAITFGRRVGCCHQITVVVCLEEAQVGRECR